MYRILYKITSTNGAKHIVPFSINNYLISLYSTSMWFWLCLVLYSVSAYPIEHIDIGIEPTLIDANDDCIAIQTINGTTLRFHNGSEHRTEIMSSTMAINQACDFVVFGQSEHNRVILWYPNRNQNISIQPESAGIDVPVSRFGFSIDVQGHTWVTGAPGQPTDSYGKGSTVGYAFVFVDDVLQSCRSPYDSYCWPIDHQCQAGFKAWKDFYDLTIEQAPAFQKKCTPFSTPWYVSGPLEDNLAYFNFQQFGYAVALTGNIEDTSTTLYISAPGDTQRFMENNDGKNYGKVYIWNIDLQDEFAWWEMAVESPLEIPNKREATYAAFGRDISANDNTLIVSSYPFYNLPKDAFTFVYDCRLACMPVRGISIDDLPFPGILNYMTPDMLTYMTPFANAEYVPAFSEALGDFQNEFVGAQVAIVGSNILLADVPNGHIYRMGLDSLRRERHSFHKRLGASTNSEHWVHDGQHNRLTHLWACPTGHVGPRETCTPCSVSYYSPDGWLEVCDPCPVNFTTTETGMSKCERWYPTLSSGLTWDSFIVLTAILCSSALACGGLLFVWQFACAPGKPRRKRVFID